jgi:hypothetical protein
VAANRIPCLAALQLTFPALILGSLVGQQEWRQKHGEKAEPMGDGKCHPDWFAAQRLVDQ